MRYLYIHGWSEKWLRGWHRYCNQRTSFYSPYFSLDMLAIYDANISSDISMATAITRMNMHHLLITFIVNKTLHIAFVLYLYKCSSRECVVSISYILILYVKNYSTRHFSLKLFDIAMRAMVSVFMVNMTIWIGLNYRFFLLLQIHIVSRIVVLKYFLWQRIFRRGKIDHYSQKFSNLIVYMIIKINLVLHTQLIYILRMKYKVVGVWGIQILSYILLITGLQNYDPCRLIFRLVWYKWFLQREQESTVSCVRNQKRKPRAYERYTRDNSSDSARILVILLRSRTRCSITEKLSLRSARGHACSSRISLVARVLSCTTSFDVDLSINPLRKNVVEIIFARCLISK